MGRSLYCKHCKINTSHRRIGNQIGAEDWVYYEQYNCNICEGTQSEGPFTDRNLKKRLEAKLQK